MKKIITFILFSLFLNDFSTAQEYLYKDLNCSEAYELIEQHKDDTNFVIIDLRPKMMYNSKHIENSVCFECLSNNINDYLGKLDKEKIYLIYCVIGKRSKTTLKKMKELNFKTVYHLYQGLREWNKQGYKVVLSDN